MLAMSNPNVNPGSVETQQMQIKAPVGVRLFFLPVLRPPSRSSFCADSALRIIQAQIRLRLRLSYLVNGQQIQDQVDFSGFPPNLMTGGQ